MGPHRVLLAIAWLSACDSSGLEIAVKPPTDGAAAPDTVRLFIGIPDEADAALAPDGFARGQTRIGNRWVRDPNNAGDVVAVAPGERVSFTFVPPGEVSELGAIIAVGYTNGTPTSSGAVFHASVGVGHLDVYDLQLHASVDPRVVANRDATTQLELWGPNPGDDSCAYLHDASPDADTNHLHKNAFVVLDNDRDCDGYADDDTVNECARDVYQGFVPPRRSDLNAAILTPTTNNPDTCVLAGSRCVDGKPRDANDHSPSKYCAGRAVCGVCAGVVDGKACISDPSARLIPTDGMFAISCHLDTLAGPTLGEPPMLCPGERTVTVPSPAGLAAPRCSRALVKTPTQAFLESIDQGATHIGITTDDNCVFTISPSGTTMQDPGMQRIGGLVTVDYSNGRGLAIPIEISFNPPASVCPDPQPCTIIGTADVPLACTTLPPP